MRKYLLILVAALFGMSYASAADWYLVGSSINNGNSLWNNSAKFKFTPSADDANVQTFQIASLSGEIKIKESSGWDTAFGSNGTKLKAGEKYSARKNGENINIDGTINDATITINTSDYTIIVTGQGQENDYDVVYLIGDFGSGWSETTTNYPLELKAGTDNVWEGEYTLSAATSYFKMKAGTIFYANGDPNVTGSIPVEIGTQYICPQNGGSFALSPGTYKFSFVLNHNAETGALTVTQDGPVTYPEQIYAVGNFNQKAYAANNTVLIPATETEGVYEGDITITSADGTNEFGYFQFCTEQASGPAAWGEMGTRYGATEPDVIPGETPVEITGNDYSWKLAEGTYTVTVSLVDKTLKAVKKTDPVPVQPLEATFVFNSTEGLAALTPAVPAYAEGSEDWLGPQNNAYFYDLAGKTLSKDNISIKFGYTGDVTATTTNSPRVFYSSKKAYDLRFYKNVSTVTVSAPEGYVLKSVTFAGGKTSGLTVSTGSEGSFTGAVWSAPEDKEVASFDLCTTATLNINTIDVTIAKKSDIPVVTNPVLYLRGAVNKWEAPEDYKFTEADNVYTLSIPKLSGEFKIGEAEWDNATTASTQNLMMEVGTEYDAIVNAQDGATNMAMNDAALKDVTVVYDRTAQKIKVTGTPYVPVTDYVLNSNLMDAAWSILEMTEAEGLWSVTCTPVNLEGKLQIQKRVEGSAVQYLGSDEAISPENKEITLADGGANVAFSGLKEGEEVTFIFDPATLKLTLKVKEEPVVDYPELYFRYAGNSFGLDNPMTCEDGIYTVSLPTLTGEFKIANSDWTVAFNNANQEMEAGQEYECGPDAAASPNMKMAKNLKDVTVTFNYTTQKIKVDGTVDEEPVVITYWIKGTFSGWQDAQMTADAVDAGKFMFTTDNTDATGEFIIFEKANAEANGVYWKAQASDALTVQNGEITLINNGGSDIAYDLTGADHSQITFAFVPATGILTMSYETGIAGIAVNGFDADALYFNMQGQRVNAPAPGLYIVVRGNKATKEMLK